MVDWNPHANDLFLQALERTPGSARASFVDQACQGDEQLKAQILDLLEANDQAGEFLSCPADELRSVFDATQEPTLGTVIGPYTLEREIGAGGMGVVYLANQSQPVRRQVALKILRAGVDSPQIVARFEAERQALALMDHPNIARVLDGGTTGHRRPYFVMELVQGTPITKYCDAHQLTLQKRLELFVPVCRAVQHAHQKGIIHRDLKPSNILVTQYDGVPVPKVIDFGVAKATGDRLTEHTFATEFGALVGTLEYMSPEQADLNQSDVDTRTDIYSLGVVLYELLTGETPFDRRRLPNAAFDEILRAIRERDPPSLSTKISTGGARRTIATNRRTELRKLSMEMRGELNWIVQKALEKDRNQRYESAGGMAADIERHLRDEPVLACPPTAGYRIRKFVRRYRRALAVTAVLLVAMIVALAGIGTSVSWAIRDRAAREARVTGQLEVLLDEVQRLEEAEQWSAALTAAERMAPLLATGEAEPGIQARSHKVLADLEFIARLNDIRAKSGTVWGDASHASMIPLAERADGEYAEAFRQWGIDVDQSPAEEAATQIATHHQIISAIWPAMDDWIAIRSKLPGDDATKRLADVLRIADPDPWRQQLRNCLVRKDWLGLEQLAQTPEIDHQPAATITSMCAALFVHHHRIADLRRAGQKPGEAPYEGANALAISTLRRAQRRFPDDFWINHRIGTTFVYGVRGGLDTAREGVGYLRAAVAVRPSNPHARMNLATGFAVLKRYDEAIEQYQQALAHSPAYTACHRNLGVTLARAGRYDAAMRSLEEAIRLPDRALVTALTQAELALLFGCCPDARFRDPQRALQLADAAIALDPNLRASWIARAVAKYREGDWYESRAAVERAQSFAVLGLPGWDELERPIDEILIALCCWQLGEYDEAQKGYGQVIEWMDQHSEWSPTLRALRTEADELFAP